MGANRYVSEEEYFESAEPYSLEEEYDSLWADFHDLVEEYLGMLGRFAEHLEATHPGSTEQLEVSKTYQLLLVERAQAEARYQTRH